MKIIVNTDTIQLYNMFYKAGKEEHQIINAKVESVLFDIIEKNNVDAYILSNNTPYFKKAVDFIKKKDPYTPIIGIIVSEQNLSVPVDIYMAEPMSFEKDPGYFCFAQNCIYNISTYIKTFATLKKLTTKLHDVIEFANCKYDPSRRILYHRVKLSSTEKDKEPEFTYKEIKKFSKKEGDILELLAINYGEVVKKEIILEKVWRKPNDYFAGRSMDVYISYLRKTFKTNKIKLNIKNISGIGLILE
jgi:DNA-binding winged helix-turn-helix (wHTH) protein